jgi:hypothetical protein
VVGLSAGFAACVFHDGKKPGDGGVVGSDGPPPDVQTECGADRSITCAGDNIRDCSGGGSAAVTACSFTCLDTGGPVRCAQFLPYGGAVTPADLLGSDAVDYLTLSGKIDSNNGKINNVDFTGDFRKVTLPATNTEVAVMVFKNLVITGDLTFLPSNTSTMKPAIAFVATGNITIDATVDARPMANCVGQPAGPGGFIGGARNADAAGLGAGAGGGGANDTGGGGGAYGGAGGTGASGGTPSAGGTPFPPSNAELIAALVGGGGGGGGGDANGGGLGGAGGGAIQFVAGGSITVTANGAINVGGCGGTNGGTGGGGDSGGGGGAGGAILLEAMNVAVHGVLAANGGGGGGGDGGNNGAAGSASTTPANGGPSGNGAGGSGAAGDTLNGATGTENNHGGGGGGGAGRIRINTRSGSADTTGATISPTLGSAGTAAATQGKVRLQ